MRGPVVEIGGQQRELKYGVFAIREIERETGMDVYQILAKASSGPLPVGLGLAIIWGGLLHALPGLKVAAVANWLDEAEFMPLAVTALEAFAASLNRTLNFKVEEKTGEGDQGKN
jgi:hypothetical protein